ncbi:hypothetical protein Lepto7375DRAFT_7313 [Leptolyngbya sp. PCC 7375]|nr:hypothetical protein Lepto7375DRAFT_7313 [Leptolyngbya sp. PCC 7375]
MTTITIRLPESEKQKLKQYSLVVERTQTDILREFIRSLEIDSD